MPHRRYSSRMRVPFLGCALAMVVAYAACQNTDVPPPPEAAPIAPLSSADAFAEPNLGPPSPDAAWLCGSLIEPIVKDRPNLYFVVDASGSMGEPLDPPIVGFSNLYDAARDAIADLLRVVGHRTNYGAAVFPGTLATTANPCPPGIEVFPTQPGDALSYALSGRDGPVLLSLLRQLARFEPQGTTPMAATLRNLGPTLESLPSPTYVFLLTDGAPNCNPNLQCTAELCEPNVTGDCPAPNSNCCDPAVAGEFANLSCIDADPTLNAVRDLATAGVKTFVLGLPGTAAFGDFMDRLAIAGQTARPTAPYYYSIDRADELADTLTQLGAQITADCVLELSEAPEDPKLVNVYFDTVTLPQGDTSGWRWLDDRHIEIVGNDCDLLKAGEVLQVQVAVGCATVIR